MGVPIVVVGNKHICPMSDGTKPHVGGTVTQGIDGVLIDGIPVAVKGSKCICTGSPSPNSITVGSPGVFVDGEPIAIVGSMTEHGGVIIDGVPGVTISGGFPVQSGNMGKPEPRIFNLQWKREEQITNWGKKNETLILSADTVGYEDGEEIVLTVSFHGDEENIIEVTGIIKDNRVEAEWIMDWKKEKEQ